MARAHDPHIGELRGRRRLGERGLRIARAHDPHFAGATDIATGECFGACKQAQATSDQRRCSQCVPRPTPPWMGANAPLGFLRVAIRHA